MPRGRVPRIVFGAGVIATMSLLVSCTSSADGSKPSASRPSTTRATTTPTSWTAPECHRAAQPAPVTSAVSGATSDRTLTSFDGTKIRVHWFPRDTSGNATATAPTLLMGPGWGSPGDTDTSPAEPSDVQLFGGLKIASLQERGYNVLTWDPRGFGASEGTVEVDSPAVEGRDVQRIIDWLAVQDGVLLDTAGDPRMGMLGGSYGGGIQLVTAASDCRIDAIVPTIAWHSLLTSLYKANTVKSGWGNLLYGAAASHSLDPHITSSHNAGNANGVLTADDEQWYEDRGPGDLVNRINIPTLFVQGTVDTLFTLNEAVTNFRALRDRDIPTSMLWYCGGHGTCLTSPGDTTRPTRATLAWLDHYVKHDPASLGPRVDIIDQNGARITANDYPIVLGSATKPITAHGAGALELEANGGSGPAKPAAQNPDALSGIVVGFTPARATNAVNVTATAGQDGALVLGTPSVVLSYRGTTPAGEKPTRVFAQVVDDTTGLVLGNQITPIQVHLDGATHHATIPLEIVAFSMKPGATVTLQLVATTTAYAQPRLGGRVEFSSVALSLPTTKATA